MKQKKIIITNKWSKLYVNSMQLFLQNYEIIIKKIIKLKVK